MNYAKHSNGQTYTGVQWRFHNFGPWSNNVNDCIEPALNRIGARCRVITSQYENSEDFKRWSLSDDRLFEKIGRSLPLTVIGAITAAVHKFKKDTPSLLEYVYQTKPMLKAAPGELFLVSANDGGLMIALSFLGLLWPRTGLFRMYFFVADQFKIAWILSSSRHTDDLETSFGDPSGRVTVFCFWWSFLPVQTLIGVLSRFSTY